MEKIMEENLFVTVYKILGRTERHEQAQDLWSWLLEDAFWVIGGKLLDVKRLMGPDINGPEKYECKQKLLRVATRS